MSIEVNAHAVQKVVCSRTTARGRYTASAGTSPTSFRSWYRLTNKVIIDAIITYGTIPFERQVAIRTMLHRVPSSDMSAAFFASASTRWYAFRIFVIKPPASVKAMAIPIRAALDVYSEAPRNHRLGLLLNINRIINANTMADPTIHLAACQREEIPS
jgi:hypothetical protein